MYLQHLAIAARLPLLATIIRVCYSITYSALKSKSSTLSSHTLTKTLSLVNINRTVIFETACFMLTCPIQLSPRLISPLPSSKYS